MSGNSSGTSKTEFTQLPLKGFRLEVPSDRPGWRKTVEGMGEGRFRIHMTKIKK